MSTCTFVLCCRIDAHYVIKVSDFGLSEDVYAKNYFRQEKSAAVKLPIKWMALESLTDGVFTEKTDVVSCMLLSVAAGMSYRLLMYGKTSRNLMLLLHPSCTSY